MFLERIRPLFTVLNSRGMVSGTFFERRLVLFKVGDMVPGDVPSSTTAPKWTKKVYTLGFNNGDEDNNSEIKMPCTFACPVWRW